jgi:O-antigen ligase
MIMKSRSSTYLPSQDSSEWLSNSDILKVSLWAFYLLGIRMAQIYNWGGQALWIPLIVVFIGVSLYWPLGAIIAMFGTTIIGDEQVVFGISLNLLVRFILVFRILGDLFSKPRITKGGITKDELKVSHHVIRNWVPFALAVILSWIPVSGQSGGIDFILKFSLTFLFLCSIVVTIRSDKVLRMLSLSLVVIGAIDGLFIVIEYLELGGGDYRVAGLLGSSNYTAAYLACLIPLALGLFSRIRSSVFFAILLGLGVLLTVSRGGVLVAMVAVTVFLLLNAKNQRMRRVLLIVMALMGLIGFQLLLSPQSEERIVGSFSAILNGSSIDPLSNKTFDRYSLWQDSVRIWRQNPIIGVGPNNWFISRLEFRPNAGPETPHLYVGQLLAETGSLGTIAFAWFVIASFSASLRQSQKMVQSTFYVLCTGWIAGGVAFVSAIFSGYAFSPYFHGFLIIAGIAPFIFGNSSNNKNLEK